ncbi:FAD binding domain-containing protein [Pleurostoma richardsiae]|uniref:FAD binding domain-containing protein n=1 Tax=Pleurostoma richardsiae TaxID=41990 RepID=A0AA38RP30_9PEZI|nr:FAD binding domain-containing protein [Pleurostoma richardsiae]
MSAKKFKIVVVGGGPVGLTAAHALYKAGIDFVVLESRHDVVVDRGAAMVLGPNNLRVMRQLGLYDRIMGIGAESLYAKGFLLNGRVFKDVPELRTLKRNHGVGLVTFHRAQLIQEFYDALPDEAKARYLTGKKVSGIESGDQGVKVTCTDGSTYEGSIVLGADGVHSITRRIMRQLALAEDPKRDWDPENPYKAEYRCMWSSFPRPPDSAPGQAFETPGQDLSLMFLTGRDRGWIMLYDRFPEPTSERHTYTEKDVEAFAARLADYPVNETLKVKDVFAQRQTSGMADLEEGIAEHWSWGRIVLAGDACHKFTPNAGLGLNNAIQDIVALFNGLHAAVLAAPDGQPDNETLARVFKTYREQRLEALKGDYGRSALVTRLQAWATRLYWFLNRFIFSSSFVANFMINYVASPGLRKGLVLDYVPATDLPAGRVTWEHELPKPLAVE